ncbi:MAG TPA: phosphate ABC transporter substrate-binding protein PstS [Anaerolineae bacterium]|jgi:phosphate transport system substrate-binding protein
MKSNLFYVSSAVLAAAVLISACGSAPVATPQAGDKTVVAATTDPGKAPKSADAAGSVQLNASGATFPQPLYEDWAFAFNQVDPSVVINYGGGGSGQGIKDIKAGNVDFAGSDAALSDKDYTDKPGLQMLPTVAGAEVLAYNVKGVTNSITLNSDVVAAIYLGKIEKWNDPAIAALNPNVTFPDTTINVIHRSDGSGTTFIFTNFLSAVSADWKSGPGAGTAVDWPADKLKRGQGGKGNQGVAAAIQNTDGAIGYLELAYARNNNILFAKQINAAGKTVEATIPSTVAAIKGAQFTDKLTSLIVNAKDDAAWPIAGFTYLIVNKDYQDCKKAQKIVSFINWALTDKGAIARAAKLLYAPLPDDVLPTVIKTANAITCQGKPVLP